MAFTGGRASVGRRDTGVAARWCAGLLAAAVVATTLTGPAAAAVPAARPFDFNGDGFADLAVGAPNTAVNGNHEAGTVHVLYAGETGVTAKNDQLLSHDTPGLQQAEYEEYFGQALASADFDRDGYADVAVAAPGHPITGFGVVHVLYGTASGLSTARDQLWQEGADGLGGERDSARFGEALAAADFDGDGFADLAIAAPYETVNGMYRAGEVHVIHGSAQGLSSNGAQTWNQDSPGVPSAAEEVGDAQWENFGAGLATGDVDRDGYAELVVGVPGETVRGSCTDPQQPCSQDAVGAGAVHVLYGSSTGLTSEGKEFWHQNTPGVRGAAWSRRGDSGKELPGEQLGRSVSVGDFDNDGFADVAASAFRDDVTSRDRTTCDRGCEGGAVNVRYGTSSGTTAAGDDYWHIDAAGVDGDGGRYFGAALASRDVDRNGHDDLAIGIPGMTVSDMRYAGAVLLLRGRAGGLHEDNDRLWTLNTPGVRGEPSTWAAFGSDVAIRPMGRSRAPELIVGAPGQDLYGRDAAGRVSVLYGSSDGPTADGDQLWSQFTPGVTGTVGDDGGRFGVLD